MLEVAERLERGAGTEVDAAEALRWYQRAVRANVTIAPALVGETVFDRDPVAGIVWLMLAFERAPDGDDAAATIATSLAVHEPRLSDTAIEAAQVWADACRERGDWPDAVLPAHQRVPAPFKPRPPTPPLDSRLPRTAPHLSREAQVGPWRCRLPTAASLETLHVGMHLRATWGGVFVLHFVATTLAPGVDLATYVKRSTAATLRHWRPRGAADRFLLRGLDTVSSTFEGLGPSAGTHALKRYTARDEHVAMLTLVAPSRPFTDKASLLEAVVDTLSFDGEA